MTEHYAAGGGQPLGKERNPWAVVGLGFLTLGIYFLVWYYKINREMRDHDERIEVRPGLAVLAISLGIIILVPPFVSYFKTAKRLQQIQAMEGLEITSSPGLALVLALFTSGIGYPAYMASLLRRHWQLHLEGYAPQVQATPAALPQLGQTAWPAGAGQGQVARSQSSAVGQLSPDGHWRWDGQSWQPVQPQPAPQPQPVQAQTAPQLAQTQAAAAGGGQLSPDGRWRWDGRNWQPVQHSSLQQETVQPQAVAAPVEQLSPDGRWRWDGQSWQPVPAPAAAQTPPRQSQTGFGPAAGTLPEPASALPLEDTSAQATGGSGGQLSPDGRWRWDGQSWQPVQR